MDESGQFLDFFKKLSTLTWLSESKKPFHFEIRSAVKNQVLYISHIFKHLACEKRPNTELFRVHIFL